MLPPETTATILPVPARPLSAAAMAQAAGAFGDDVHALGGRCASPRRSRRATRRSSRRRASCSSGHIVGSTDLPPAPSTNDGCPAVEVAGLAARAATSRAAPRSRARRQRPARRASARASREPMPASRPPPPSGATTASTSGRSSRISRPAVRVAGNEVVVVERMHEVAAHAVGARATRPSASTRRRWP